MPDFAFLPINTIIKQRLIVLICACLLAACAGAPVNIQHHDLADVRAKITAAGDADAERCAPKAQAQAVAQLYWAAHELEEDFHVYEAGELIVSAGASAEKALKLAKENCAPTPVLTEPPERDIRISLESILFKTDSSELNSTAIDVLNRAINALKKHSDMHIEIAGHTDYRHSETYNMALSRCRATRVYLYLLNHGIEKTRMEQKGYGESQPIASNNSEQGMAKNRRVELHIR